MLISPIVSEPYHIIIKPKKDKPKEKVVEVIEDIVIDDKIDQEDLNNLELELRIDYNDKLRNLENIIKESFNKLNDKIDIEVSKINMEFDKLNDKIDKKLDAIFDELAHYINKVEDLEKEVDENKKEINIKDQELTEMIIVNKKSILLEVNSNKTEIDKKNKDLNDIMTEITKLIHWTEAHITGLDKRMNILENLPENVDSSKIPIILGSKRKKIE
jgi:hypothetical protein